MGNKGPLKVLNGTKLILDEHGNNLSLVLLIKKVTLMILLERFLVRLMIGINKNPSRRIINVTFLSKRTRLKWFMV